MLHLKRRNEARRTAYEARLAPHEAALRAMKRSLFRLHVFCPSGQKNGGAHIAKSEPFSVFVTV